MSYGQSQKPIFSTRGSQKLNEKRGKVFRGGSFWNGPYVNFLLLIFAFAVSCDQSDSLSPGEKIAVSGIAINKEQTVIAIGGSETLYASVIPYNAKNTAVQWSVDDSTKIEITQEGVVTGKLAGNALVTVTSDEGGFTAECIVVVASEAVSVTGITLDDSSMTILMGDKRSLRATIQPLFATNQKVKWKSDNTVVATVSDGGDVSALSLGTTLITVTTEDGGFTANCSITVN